MPLTHEQIVDAAVDVLRRHGLADLTMRRLASELGVQPGALYWHVPNKQTLLVRVTERVLGDISLRGSGHPAADIRRLAKGIRAAVLPIPDGSDVVALSYALDPDASPVFVRLRTLTGELADSATTAAAAAALVIHHVLGSIGDEQNRRLADLPTHGAAVAFDRGLDLALTALTATSLPRSVHG